MKNDARKLVSSLLMFCVLLCVAGCVGSASRAIPITSQNSILVRQGRYDEAIANLSRAAKDYPDKGYVWYWLAEAYYGKKDYVSAARSFEKALSLDLSQAQKKGSYSDLGWSYLWTGRPQKAIYSFSEVLKLDPTWNSAILGRGLCYRQVGRFEEAIKDLTNFLQSQPNHKRALVSRAWCYFFLQRYTESLADFNRVEALQTGARQDFLQSILTGQGWCNYCLGNFKVALAKFNQALKVPTFNDKTLLSRAYRGKAFVMAALGNYPAAFKSIELARAAKEYDTSRDLAMLHYVAGNKEAAWKLIGGAGYLGVHLQALPSDKGPGIAVVKVEPKGPADKAGLLPGDIIVKYQDKAITNLNFLLSSIKATHPGTRVLLTVIRQLRSLRIPVIIGQADAMMAMQTILVPIFKYAKPKAVPAPTPPESKIASLQGAKRGSVVTPRGSSRHMPHIPKTTTHIAHVPKQKVKHIPKQPKPPASIALGKSPVISSETKAVESGSKLAAVKAGAASPSSIQIDEIKAVPREIPPGEAFDIVVDFTIKDPEAGEKELPIVVERTIYKGGQIIHRFQPAEKNAPNGKPWELIFAMIAATEKGKYTMEMVFRYKDQEIKRNTLFVIK